MCHGTPSEPLNVTNPQVFDFVTALYKEVVSLWDDPLIHIGGDEVDVHCWNASEQIHAWMEEHHVKDVVDLQSYFELKLIDFVLTELRKRPIVWQELFDLGFALPNETIIDVWKQESYRSTLLNATRTGYQAILSACWYLDHLEQDWNRLYHCDPRDFNGTDVQKTRVIGGHASMWGEMVDETIFEPRVWPRTSAVAEKLWTGNQTNATLTRFERLHAFRCKMVQQGIRASPVQPGSCWDVFPRPRPTTNFVASLI